MAKSEDGLSDRQLLTEVRYQLMKGQSFAESNNAKAELRLGKLIKRLEELRKNINFEKDDANRKKLDESHPDVQKILKIAHKAVSLVPDIEKLEKKIGKLKEGERDQFLDKLIDELKTGANVGKHWNDASEKSGSATPVKN